MRLQCKLLSKQPVKLGILLLCAADPKAPAPVPDAAKAQIGLEVTCALPALLRLPAPALSGRQLLSRDLSSDDFMKGYLSTCTLVIFVIGARLPKLFTRHTIDVRWYGTLIIMLTTLACYKPLAYKTRRFPRSRRYMLGCLFCSFCEALLARLMIGRAA